MDCPSWGVGEISSDIGRRIAQEEKEPSCSISDMKFYRSPGRVHLGTTTQEAFESFSRRFKILWNYSKVDDDG